MKTKQTEALRTPSSVKGHPLHTALVAFPLALWTFSLVCDVAGLIDRENWLWQSVAFYALVGGLLGALAAAIPGLIDLLALRDPVIQRIGVRHAAFNLAAIAVFAGDIWLRLSDAVGTRLPVAISLIGVALLGVAAWLGGDLVHVYGVGTENSGTQRTGTPFRREDLRAARGSRAH